MSLSTHIDYLFYNSIVVLYFIDLALT